MTNAQVLTPQQKAARNTASEGLPVCEAGAVIAREPDTVPDCEAGAEPEVEIRNFGADTLHIALPNGEVKTVRPSLRPNLGERLEVRQAKSEIMYLETTEGLMPMIEATDVSIGYSKATSSSPLSDLEVHDLNVNDEWAFNILPMKDALKLMGGFKPKSRVGFGYVDPRTALRYEDPTQHVAIVIVAMGEELRQCKLFKGMAL